MIISNGRLRRCIEGVVRLSGCVTGRVGSYLRWNELVISWMEDVGECSYGWDGGTFSLSE